MKNRITVLAPIVVALACSALAPVAHATPPSKSEDRGNGNSAAENVQALNIRTTGSDNTAHGWFSLFSNTTGSSNTADGFQALYTNTDGGDNTAYAFQAMYTNTGSFDVQAGSFNTAVGYQALYSNSADIFHFAAGSFNTAVGYQALFSNISGSSNTATGNLALYTNTIGLENTAIGYLSLFNTTGGDNTAIGFDALGNNTTGGGNTALGHQAGLSVTTANNVICIGSIGAANVDNSCFIGNIRGTTTSNFDALPVLIDSAGQLGTQGSSRRFKREIKTMGNASEAILSLKPVSFHYKSDAKNIPQFGLIAEEVAKVNPALVVLDKDGKPYSVRYDAVNAMLLNEFLKAHKTVEGQNRELENQERKIQEQEVTIAELNGIVAKQEKGMEALAAQLKAQAAQIQKVSAQIEISRPAPRTVLNNR